MTDRDLTQIGIEAFGARRRMQQAIAGRIQREKYQILRNLCFFYNENRKECKGDGNPLVHS